MSEVNDTELSVLRMSAGGMTHGEIAFALDMSVENVEIGLAGIVSKFDASSIESAAAAAAAAGLLQIEL